MHSCPLRLCYFSMGHKRIFITAGGITPTLGESHMSWICKSIISIRNVTLPCLLTFTIPLFLFSLPWFILFTFMPGILIGLSPISTSSIQIHFNLSTILTHLPWCSHSIYTHIYHIVFQNMHFLNVFLLLYLSHEARSYLLKEAVSCDRKVS